MYPVLEPIRGVDVIVRFRWKKKNATLYYIIIAFGHFFPVGCDCPMAVTRDHIRFFVTAAPSGSEFNNCSHQSSW